MDVPMDTDDVLVDSFLRGLGFASLLLWLCRHGSSKLGDLASAAWLK